MSLPEEENAMAIDTTACYYGRHFGCVNVLLDPDCRLCAERLTHAVNQAVHHTTASAVDAPTVATIGLRREDTAAPRSV
jgi:hypothetical protein